MHFKHKIPAKDVSIYDAPMEWADENCEMPHSDAEIDFEVQIESRSYGIKGIHTYVNKVSVEINDNNVVFKDEEGGWSVCPSVEHTSLACGEIVPSYVDIYYEEKLLYVRF